MPRTGLDWSFGVCVGCITAARAAYLTPVILLVALGACCAICWAFSWGMSATTVPTLLMVPVPATLSMAKHTDHISRSAYLEIRRISSVRHLLTRKAAVQLMCSFVLSRLDHCNSLLIDITSDQMYCLQKIQSHAAKVFFHKSKHERVTPLFKKLHWIPVKERILFKIATFAFRFFDGTLPPYLSSCLSVYTPSRTLRSNSDEKPLSSAKWKLKGFGHRSFSVQAPLV